MEIRERDDEVILRRIVIFECADAEGNAFLRLDDAFKDRQEAVWFGEALRALGQQLVDVARVD
jgi:hypothetical protein